MNCQETIEFLWAHLDGEVEPSLRREVEAHLSGCEVCRRELEQSRRLGGALRRYAAPSAPAGFAERTIRRARPVSLWRRLPIWQAAAAAALLAAGALVYTALQPVGGSGEGPVAQEPKKPEPVKIETPAVPAPESREPVETPLVAQAAKEDEEEILQNLDLLENWEVLNDPDVALALSLPDEELEALVGALEEGGM